MQINKNEYICCDCIDGLNEMIKQHIKVDGVITSPPYNIVRPNSIDRGYDIYKDGMTNEQYSKWIVDIFNRIYQVLDDKGIIILNMSYGCENTECMNLTIADIIKQTKFSLADIIVWKKQSATPNNVSPNKLTRICEFIYVFCKDNHFNDFNSNKSIVGIRDTNQKIYQNVFNFIQAKNNDENCPLNKATYSTELVQKLINIYFKKGNAILDVFGGTGTTELTCYKNDIDFYSFELSSEQVKWSKERFEKETQQLSLFYGGVTGHANPDRENLKILN